MTSASACLELKPGTMIGSYRIDGELGRGGMGAVYRASHVVLPRRAAIKVMHRELRRQPGMASRVVQEAAILEDVRHPGLVRVFECNVLPDQRPYIVMELVDGETLTSRLDDRGRLPWHEVAALVADLADVLSAVHTRGIVHRDLKPDNLLLTPADHDYPLRVIDWGVARLGSVGRLTLEGLTPGTPIYMSPEQACGHHIAAPCDIYSLGVIAYEALCGHTPFEGRTLAEVVCKHITSDAEPIARRCSAPRAMCELVHRMLDKDPAARPMAVDVRQEARTLAQDRSPTVDADPSFEPETRVADAEELEFGVTELLPTMRKPRWTPQLEAVPRPSTKPITPKSIRDQVSGEIVARRR